MVGAMGVDVVQRLNAIERSRSGLKKTAAPLEVVESLDRGVAGPAGASDSEAAAQSKLAPPKRAYPAPAESPTQLGPNGLRFDFNDGCRVFLPESDHPWRARMCCSRPNSKLAGSTVPNATSSASALKSGKMAKACWCTNTPPRIVIF